MGSTLFWGGDYGDSAELTTQECEAVLQDRGVDTSALQAPKDLRVAVAESTPKCALARSASGTVAATPCKWKTSYAHAELDSKRVEISEEEVAYYRWELLYHGQPSR